ncbi:MAG: DUF2834 domain-containing protein [Rubrivivax sp.]|nr:DUF2834 domain-containing protein [Rubrivivax sp.]
MRIVLWLVTLAFGAYSLWVMAQVGYIGLWQAGLSSPATLQILLDLVISCVLLVGFVVRDARANGRTWWPWALVTLAAGSFGPLAYLLWPQRRSAPAGAGSTA